MMPAMEELELPHSRGCLVCGRDNPHGLQLCLHVRPSSGVVVVRFTPQPHHVGFVGITHGGALATVLDEAMVWAATWSGRRFCVAGEFTVRFRRAAEVGMPLLVEASATALRRRLIEVTGMVVALDAAGAPGEAIATASGKYVPMDDKRNAAILATLTSEPSTRVAREYLLARPDADKES
jgi:acyl-coenzyme A thioesterase PaaI-like protein